LVLRKPAVVSAEVGDGVRPAAVAVCAELSMSRESAASEVRARQVFIIQRWVGLREG
jgi:hypothetical protein